MGDTELLISCQADDHSRERRDRLGMPGQTGTFVLSPTTPLGPIRPPSGPSLRRRTPLGTRYAGKLLELQPGDWRFLAFRGNGDRDFLGELTDPLPVTVERDGRLSSSRFARARRGSGGSGFAPEIQSLIDWGAAVAAVTACSRPRAPNCDPRRARPRTSRPQGRRRRAGRRRRSTSRSMSAAARSAHASSPLTCAGPQPAFVHFHGGGFVFGTIDSLVNDAKCAHICREAGCVVITVEYRLAPEHRFPVAAEDCYAALDFARGQRRAAPASTRRIAVGGESAGGNLAADGRAHGARPRRPGAGAPAARSPRHRHQPRRGRLSLGRALRRGLRSRLGRHGVLREAYLDDPADGASRTPRRSCRRSDRRRAGARDDGRVRRAA